MTYPNVITMKFYLHTFFFLLGFCLTSATQAQTTEEVEKIPVVTNKNISSEELSHFGSIYQLLGTNESCKVTSFHILRVPNDLDRDVIMELISSDRFNEQVQKLVRNVRTGDVLYVEKIRSIGDCLQYQGEGADAFKITVL